MAALFACNEQGEETSDEFAAGYSVVKNTCTSCHKMDPEGSEGLAPNLNSIREAYLKASNGDEARFKEMIIAFLLDPSAETTKMPYAVDKYGQMPNFGLTEEQASDVANYLFGGYGTAQEESTEQAGHEIARSQFMALKAVLGKNLLGSIQEKGTAGAVEFCSIRALPLTDSISREQGVEIRRVSDKPRNPLNNANEHEREIIAGMRQQLSKGEKPGFDIMKEGPKTSYYFPIITNEMCMQCHGQKDIDITAETQKVINEKYPDDQATGYGVGELRGVFVVTGN